MKSPSMALSYSQFVLFYSICPAKANIARNYEPLPTSKRDETLPCALFLFIGKCMEMIVQSIAEEIKVVEFHSPNPKFFRCGNTFNLEVVSLPNII